MFASTQNPSNSAVRSRDALLESQYNQTAFSAGPGWLVGIVFVVFAVLIIIFPNSLRLIKYAMFPTLAVFSFFQLRKLDTELLILWGFIACINTFYLVFPPQPLMTPVNFAQIGLVYVAAPLFWILICEYVLTNYRIEAILNFFFWCIVLSFLAVIAFYYLFLNYGAKAVWMFMDYEHANVDFELDEHNFKATMHIFGSLIFLGPAIVASETLGFFRKLIAVFLLAAIGFFSGRDALLLVLGLGAAIYIAFRYLDIAKQKISLTAIVVSLLIVAVCFTEVGNAAMGQAFKKIEEFGGVERSQQYTSLLRGIEDNWLMGSGHTSHVSLVRDTTKPWRYEILPLALMLRVGLIGTLVYFYPIISSVWRFGILFRIGQSNQFDIFMLTATICTMLGTMTNPYLESFEFQWCLFLPYCYFRRRIVQV